MKLKRIGCGILAIILSLPLAAPVNSYGASKFSDTSGHWAESYINTAVNKKIITGYPDGRFSPDKAVTRAEFATMVNKALGNAGTENLAFSDVVYGEWYYNDVSKAVAAAYTAGYDDNTFRPNNPITRQEAAVMISRIVPIYGTGGNLKAYSDYKSIADWAYDAVEKVNGKGYIGAYNDGKIHPVDQLTRGQTAKIICDMIDKETIVTSSPVIDDDGTKLSGKIYSNNVTIDEDLGEDSATIDNCVILGTLSVKGGGTETITVNNSRVANVAVNKDDDPVRILAKGQTAISKLSASQACILQTSSLGGGLFGSGFSNITVNGSAEVTLKGTFPKVNVSGTKAKVTLDSGTIDSLTVGGRYSDITAASNTTISTATVNTQSYFHGSGTISQMNVNADDVTYETKPKRWTIASSADTPTQSDGTSAITFSPKNGATKVKLDATITITFDSAMKMYDGDTISNSDIDDFVVLRKSSSSGSKVGYTATINSAKKIISIVPDASLTKDTKYYVIIDKNSLRDSDGNGNTAQSISFTTGDTYGSVTTTFSPVNGAATIPVNTSISIAFSEDVVRYSNAATISTSDSYLKDCLVFRKTSASGETVSYSVTINSAKKMITITPSSNLDLNQKYYVAVVANKLKTKTGGASIPASSVTWTTGSVDVTAINTAITRANNAKVNVSQSVNGTDVYTTDYWVTSAQMTALDNAIATATSAKSTVLTTAAAGAAAATLDTATNSFLSAKSLGSKIKVDTVAIDTAIAAADASKINIETSADGSNVDPARQWVTPDQMSTLNTAINTATEAKSTVQSVDAVNTAAGALYSAVSTFNTQKSYGTKPIIVKNSLSSVINTANNLRSSTFTSLDGTDIATDKYWVTSGTMSTFTSAITTAETVLGNPSATQAEVDNAASAMNSAIEAFSDLTVRKLGTKVTT